MTPNQETRRAIPTGSAGRRPPALPLILAALSLLTVGMVAGLVIGNRLLTAQLAIYGEANMAATSVVLDLMDDFLTPLVLTISVALALAILTLVSWLVAGVRDTVLRYAVAGLLAALLIVSGLWFGLGRRTSTTAVTPVTPTPVGTLP